jgi:hypothetical protein
MAPWAQDLATVAVLSMAVAWLLARWLHQGRRSCSTCVPRFALVDGRARRGRAAAAGRRLPVIR